MKAQSVSRTVVSCATTHEDPPPSGQRGAEALHPCDTRIRTVPLDPPVKLQKATAQTVESILVQRRSQARLLDRTRCLGASRALALARSLIKTTPSSFHLPPVSMPTTTSLHRPGAASSVCVASLSRLVATNIAPFTSAA